MSWAAIMGLDELLAKLQREAGTPGTPEYTGGVPGVSARGELPTLAAEPIERTGDDPDDRRRCDQCGNLRGAVCIIAKPGGLVSAIVGYRPALPEMLQRCAGFSPRTLA